LQCGLFRSNFSFAITQLLAPSFQLKTFIPVGFVIRANEFLFINQSVNHSPIELREIFRVTFAENFKSTMPTPEIPHPVPPIANRLIFHFGRDVSFSLPQKPRPDSVPAKNNFKLGPLTFSDPEPAVDDEPRRCQSFRRALHLGDDFLRDRTRSLLIARKVHGIFRAALR